jgi:hypothetical protein
MIYTKQDAVGIDVAIQSLQSYLYSKLTSFGVSDYESYGRIYKNGKNGKLIPERYTEGNEYEEVLFNDKMNMTSFFAVADVTPVAEKPKALVSVIFQLKLDKVFPLISHRADEEFINLIVILFEKYHKNIQLKSIVRGIDQVYKEFDKTKIKWTDMQDFNVVRFDIELNYDYSCKYNAFFFDNVDGPYINFASILSEFLLIFSKEKKATNCYLKNSNIYSNEIPIILPFNCAILGLFIQGSKNQTWKGQLHVEGVSELEVDMANNTVSFLENINHFVEKNKKISVYLEGSLIEKPKVIIHLKRL